MPDTNPRYTAEVKLLEKLRQEILNRKSLVLHSNYGFWKNDVGTVQSIHGVYDPLDPKSVYTLTFRLKGKYLSEKEGDVFRRKSSFDLEFALFDYNFLIHDMYEFVINGGKSLVAPSYNPDLSYYVPDGDLYTGVLLDRLKCLYLERSHELPKKLLLPLPVTRVTSVQVRNNKSNRVIEDFNAHDILHHALTLREIEFLEPIVHSFPPLMEIYQEVMQRGSVENIEMILKAINR